MVVRSDAVPPGPATLACVPVAVIPTRSPARTAYANVFFTKTAQATSSRTKVITSKGRKAKVNSIISEPLRLFDLDILVIVFQPAVMARTSPARRAVTGSRSELRLRIAAGER